MLFQHNIGLFLYSQGSSRAVIDFFGRCGLSSSYQTVLKAHKYLADNLRKKAAQLARRPHMLGFDNIQISMSTHRSQRPGATPAVTSFTGGIIYALRNALSSALSLLPILERRKKCKIITYSGHIKQTSSERASFFQHIQLDVIEILFKNTKGFQTDAYKDLIVHETHRPPPPDHKTTEFVCPTYEICQESPSTRFPFSCP